MEPKRSELAVPNVPATGKKAYHKPVISVYGNLTDVTNSNAMNPATHKLDGGICWGNPPSLERT